MTTYKFVYGLTLITISLSAGIFTPVQSQAAVDDRFAIGDLTYRVLTEDDSSGTVSVSHCDEGAIAVIIPPTVVNDGKTYTVTTIGMNSFGGGCRNLEGIKIPDTVTTIESFAFSSCLILESITIPASVTYIDYGLFGVCHRLACVYYEGNVPESPDTMLYYGAFQCLTSYYRAENKDSWEPLIDENHKWKERRIECIDKPVTETKGIAYEYHEDGTATVTGIGTASETDIVIPTTVENPNDGKTYIVRSIGNSAFQGTGITSLTMGSSIETIGDNAFQSCVGLTKAMIGSCVRSMGENVFQDCSNLMEVYYDGYIPDIKGEIYTNTPQELISYYNKAEKIFWENSTILGSWQNRKALCITETMIKGTEGLFYDNFTEEGTVSVMRQLFTSENIVIAPEYLMGRRLYTVTTIPNKAFSGSTFTNIVIPDTITTIEQFAFQNCKKFTSITLPKSVSSLGSYLFNGCNSLTSVYYQGDVPSVNGTMLYATAPDSLISYYPMRNTSWENAGVDGYWMGRKAIPIKKIDDLIYLVLTEEGITGTVSVKSWGSVEGEIIIPDFIENEGITYKVTEIEDYAFYNCSNLTSITLPESIISIKDYAFYNCSNLTSITLPESIISIKDYAFHNCNSLLNITIPDSVTSIGSSAFAYCSSLTNITIPKSVTSIGINAFGGCNSLTSVYYQGDVPSVKGTMLYATTPNSLISYYPEGNASWEAAIQNGQWQRRGTATWNPLPPAMAELTYSFDNGILTLSFTGTLEESDDTVNWIPVQEAVTPYIVDINKEKKFYRSVQ